MHPMFAQLYLEPGSGEDEQDERRRATRSRRQRSVRTLTRVNVSRNTGNRDTRATARAH